ncbi:MAG: GGDEF domain-containing protein [Mesorhizobium sp.]
MSDTASRIVATMRQMGVVGLPRNYEIFYEICTGSNEALCNDVLALGNRPKQEDLDRISRRYFASNNGASVVDAARDEIATKIEDVMALLRRERSSLEKYGNILGTTSEGLGRSAMTRDLLVKIVGIMSAATDSTIEQGKQIAASISDKSAELEKVKVSLEEYKRLAETDPLTLIANRRSFDSRLSQLFSSEKSRMFGALILADIDRFKDVNDRFGHPVGDRILQAVARVISANVGEGNFVARAGGEEFAIIAEGLSEDGISRLAESVRIAVEQAAFKNPETGAQYGPVTLSFGICMVAESGSADDLYAKADRALYASKVSGRNQVTRHSSLVNQTERRNWFIYKSD